MRLVIFDVDGTLVDSQGDIVASMTAAFEGEGLTAPDRTTILSIVGLSLPDAVARLAPGVGRAQTGRMVEAYKAAYQHLRRSAPVSDSSPLFPGARAALDRLNTRDETLLAVATGKSMRGLRSLIDGHGLEGMFVSLQCADFHPSKPHPAMVTACLDETGITADQAVMVGDTTFDMDMAAAAGVRSVGVSWGYHAAAQLRADRVIDTFDALDGAIDDILEGAA